MLTFAMHNAGHGDFYWIGPLIFIGLVGLFWVLAARRCRKHGYTHFASRHGHWKSPGMRILEERYANGEIDRDEFFARKKDLASPTKT